MIRPAFLILSACGLFLGLVSVNNTDSAIDVINKYCAVMRSGKVEVIHQGKTIVSEVILANGTTVKPDGRIFTASGKMRRLKDGECVDKEGNIFKQKRVEFYLNK